MYMIGQKYNNKDKKIFLRHVSDVTQAQGDSNIGIKGYSYYSGIEMRQYQSCGIRTRNGLCGIIIGIS